MRMSGVLVILLLLVSPSHSSHGSLSPLSFEERVQAQRAIEEVHWRHVLWPAVNQHPKPPLGAVLPDSELRLRVTDSLSKSMALSTIWQRPITSLQLQSELDRMVRSSRNHAVLSELFAALRNDPQRITECLVRPALVERLFESWYSMDPRFHGALRSKALQSLEHHHRAVEMPNMGGRYLEITLEAGQGEPALASTSPALGGAAPFETASSLTGLHSHPTAPIEYGHDGPIGIVSELHEDKDRFYVTAVLRRSSTGTLIGMVEWRKESATEWWNSHRHEFEADAGEPLATYQVPSLSSACVADTWHRTFSVAPSSRFSPKTVWTGTELIIWGGYLTTNSWSNTGARYNPVIDAWFPVSEAGAPMVNTGEHTAVWTGTEMLVFGGGSGGRYDPVNDAWRPINLSGAPPFLALHSSVWTGAEMIVWAFGAGARYDPVADAWQPLPAPPILVPGRIFWTGTEMIVLGGGLGIAYNPRHDAWRELSAIGLPTGTSQAVWSGNEIIVWNSESRTGARFEPVSEVWTPMSSEGSPAARSGASAVWDGREFILWGGWHFGPLNTGGRYDPELDRWLPTSTTGASPRNSPIATWTGQEMIVWGGFENAGARYDPVSDTWVPVGLSGTTPSARRGNSMVWTGSELIIWGGFGTTVEVFTSGGRYDPALDHWRAISSPAGVAGDGSHTTVWTGLDMIVWGIGNTGTGLAGQGVKYNPLTDSWTTLSTTNAPTDRSGHSAVWTGEEMIIWGGFTSSLTATGGRYNPLTDEWRATSVTGAASPRSFHTAVWAEHEMIVWGSNDDFALWQGGRYDPVADLWRPLAPPMTLSPRLHSCVIWTGTRLIIWGGISGYPILTVFNDGASYDPTTETWDTASLASSAPSPRSPGACVWTGAEMLVWGGRDLLSGVFTGGKYSPSAGRWSPISSEGAPRITAPGVWSGEEMIVWGGQTPLGGRYCTDPLGTVYSWYRDEDGDGYGVGAPILARSKPSGTASNSGDCDDARADVHPLASERCNAVDDNCDGDIDDGFDQDRDGFTQCGGDCNDSNSDTHPGTLERCDGIDNDCNEATDENLDYDGDEYTPCGGDCDDTDGGVHPDQVDSTCDLRDDNCNGRVDESYKTTSLVCGVGACQATGYRRCDSGNEVESCTPLPPTPEVCDAIDNDCDGVVDDDDPQGGQDCGVSNLGQCRLGSTHCSEGHLICLGSVGPSLETCNGFDDDCDGNLPPSEVDSDSDGVSPCNGDCNDTSSAVVPGATEIPGNFQDENCDGTATCSPASTWRTHGEFAACVIRECTELVRAGQLSMDSYKLIVKNAADSDVGQRQRPRAGPPHEP